MRKNFWFFLVLYLAFLFIIVSPRARGSEDKISVSPPIQTYAQYLTTVKFQALPKDAVQKAKYLILDSIGCALGGAQTDPGKRHIALGKDLGGNAESTVIGDGAQVSSMNAAYVNAQLSNLLDFDDIDDFYPPGHPGNAIVQTALALGQSVKASGEELLTAVIVGYEVCQRVGRASGSLLWQTNLDSLAGLVGPAAVSSRLLKLDRGAAVDVFHLAQLLGGGGPKRHKFDIPAEMVIPSIKSNYGLDALLGILAAHVAKQGIRGYDNLLDGGLETWFLAGGEVSNYKILTQGLGTKYLIVEMSFKPTPSCRWTHVPITAAREALNGKPVKEDEVSQIIIKGVERLKRYEWDTMLDAQFSIPCALALDLVGETPGPRWYTTGRFKDAEIRRLASKVKYEHDRRALELEIKEGKMICTVEIVFKDGKTKKASIEHIKGAPDNPMSEDELFSKFRENATPVLSEPQIKKVIDMVMNLEKLSDVSLLTKLLSPAQ